MVSDPETETGLVLAAGGIMSTFEFWNVDKIPEVILCFLHGQVGRTTNVCSE